MPERSRNTLVFLVATLVLLCSMWVANQGGLAPLVPAKFAASLYLILTSLPSVTALWLAALGFGWPLRRLLVPELPARLVLQAGLGMAALLLLNWLVLWGIGSATPVVWGLVGAGVLLGVAQLVVVNRKPEQPRIASPPRALPWSLALPAVPLGVLLVAVTLPPGTLWRVEAFGYDVLSYHLQIPREWLAGGGMLPLRHNVYSFLPGLLEAGYTTVAALQGGGVVDAVYACQLFHASLAIYAALAIGSAVATLAASSELRHAAGAGCVAAAVFLAVPWTLITGSLAYNEMGVMAFAAAAVVVLLDVRSERPRAAAAIGFLCGAATLVKPTAGFLVAVPLGLVLLTRLNHAVRWRSPPAMREAAIAAVVAGTVGLLTLSPYLVRNYAWTGNPVFPFATGTLGLGHWDAELADRWDRGHGLASDREQPLGESLARQWLFNAGYGAVGGEPTPRESRNIARFPREYGVPILWLAVGLAALFTVRQLRLRRAVGAMLLVLGLQLAFWLAATHLQSRFLVPTVLPACVIIGLGFATLRQLCGERLRIVPPIAALTLVLTVASHGLVLFWEQTTPVAVEGRRVPAPPFVLVDALGEISRSPLDELPRSSKVLLVADNSSLLYIDPAIVYNTAFDANPLGTILRDAGDDPAAVTARLRELGVTHVWVHWSELDRLHATYGFDRDVTEPRLRQLATAWRTVTDSRVATLYALP